MKRSVYARRERRQKDANAAGILTRCNNEMEIARTAPPETGQIATKIHPAIKAADSERRLLERQDNHEQALKMTVPEEGTRKRMRGSRAVCRKKYMYFKAVCPWQSKSKPKSKSSARRKSGWKGQRPTQMVDEESDDEKRPRRL
jgi:hypothetical protein